VILIDSNIPMYLIGAPHPRKAESQILLERLVAAGERIVTDAEVMQEILHRYTAIGRRHSIAAVIRLTLDIVDEIYPIEKRDVLRASEIVQGQSGLGARHAIHVAIIERYQIGSILSFDSDFDRWPGLQRVHQV
jgi:predicted nucleic acid-binding protein